LQHAMSPSSSAICFALMSAGFMRRRWPGFLSGRRDQVASHWIGHSRLFLALSFVHELLGVRDR